MKVVLVPGTLALLPEYAGRVDAVADLRAACLAAVSWLDGAGPVEVVAGEQGARVAGALLSGAGVSRLERQGALAPHPPEGGAAAAAYLVVGNGSACRSEKAPGHLDPRAADFDAALGRALRRPDPAALAGIDADLSRALLAETAPLQQLAKILTPRAQVSVDYDDDPFGVQYWVIRWELPALPE